ncbi:hypothetical protein BU24DRAFT_252984 [Aaosphaeria arxii CBS 175.79]|uniref:Uncharacterized protein n=1 Tax=Aaosphaeria arxii CBS 175.79 TaxID=1450172 RepID=A0A6A5XHY5_9PLEO|nr:uncharacterized protein BU24DRAFT_252984 [Aaosphaeria arxii CBS 175.79]KAF2012489.1 hypothetical protein BU24DRAFT_252984 [Aaosphaeria arxii CBS 175.79]
MRTAQTPSSVLRPSRSFFETPQCVRESGGIGECHIMNRLPLYIYVFAICIIVIMSE